MAENKYKFQSREPKRITPTKPGALTADEKKPMFSLKKNRSTFIILGAVLLLIIVWAISSFVGSGSKYNVYALSQELDFDKMNPDYAEFMGIVANVNDYMHEYVENGKRTDDKYGDEILENCKEISAFEINEDMDYDAFIALVNLCRENAKNQEEASNSEFITTALNERLKCFDEILNYDLSGGDFGGFKKNVEKQLGSIKMRADFDMAVICGSYDVVLNYNPSEPAVSTAIAKVKAAELDLVNYQVQLIFGGDVVQIKKGDKVVKTIDEKTLDKAKSDLSSAIAKLK